MLIEFKVANYRSIRAEQTLSMVASNYSDELPQNLISCDHVPGLKGTKLVKAVALYGANASGKSNIVAALRFFVEFVRDSATQRQLGTPTGTQPFKLDHTCLPAPSKFEITVVINGIRTLYGIEMTRERVTSEYLVAYPNKRPQVWFERDWDAQKKKYVWSNSTEHFNHDAALREKTREDAAFLSVAAHFDHKGAKEVVKWFRRSFKMTGSTRFPARQLERLLSDNPELCEFFGQYVEKIDLGITRLQTRAADRIDLFRDAMQTLLHGGTHVFDAADVLRHADTKSDSGFLSGSSMDSEVIPELLHRGAGKSEVPLDFYQEESAGTQRYLSLLSEICAAIGSHALLVADEIEASFHPLVIHQILRIFVTANSQPDAQLLFTTHNPLLLDQTLLRRDQIWFTEKDQEGATRLYPLTDFKPRKDESLVKGYLTGRYGGIPFIPEGLKF